MSFLTPFLHTKFTNIYLLHRSLDYFILIGQLQTYVQIFLYSDVKLI